MSTLETLTDVSHTRVMDILNAILALALTSIITVLFAGTEPNLLELSPLIVGILAATASFLSIVRPERMVYYAIRQGIKGKSEIPDHGGSDLVNVVVRLKFLFREWEYDYGGSVTNEEEVEQSVIQLFQNESVIRDLVPVVTAVYTAISSFLYGFVVLQNLIFAVLASLLPLIATIIIYHRLMERYHDIAVSLLIKDRTQKYLSQPSKSEQSDETSGSIDDTQIPFGDNFLRFSHLARDLIKEGNWIGLKRLVESFMAEMQRLVKQETKTSALLFLLKTYGAFSYPKDSFEKWLSNHRLEYIKSLLQNPVIFKEFEDEVEDIKKILAWEQEKEISDLMTAISYKNLNNDLLDWMNSFLLDMKERVTAEVESYGTHGFFVSVFEILEDDSPPVPLSYFHMCKILDHYGEESEPWSYISLKALQTYIRETPLVIPTIAMLKGTRINPNPQTRLTILEILEKILIDEIEPPSGLPSVLDSWKGTPQITKEEKETLQNISKLLQR
jgi:hypothetical protein